MAAKPAKVAKKPKSQRTNAKTAGKRKPVAPRSMERKA
jgi:hypothetical protein